MKLIQSWWDITKKGKLPDKEIPITELSRMTLEHNFDSKITFYTDLNDTSGLGYSDVKSFDMSGYPKEIWCLGKLVAMAQQTEPFVHLDTDVFLWRKTPIEKLEKPFIVFHHETWVQQFMNYAHLVTPPPSLGKTTYDYFDSSNFAIVGGTAWKDLVECAQEILEHIKKHQDEIVTIGLQYENDPNYRMMWTPVLVEQVWMSQMMRKRKIPPVTYLGDKWKPFNPFYHSNIEYRAKKQGIAHYWSYTKNEHYNSIVEAHKKWKTYLENPVPQA